ncbi:hypothetical protein ACLI4Y_07215 [Natrialbaceae archaeon A-CW3]
MKASLQYNSRGKRSVPGRDDSGELPQNDVFDILSNYRRVCVIQYLQNVERDVVELRDVVDYVTERETLNSPQETNYSNRKSVYTALRQTHLPKLDDLGVIDYNKSRGEMRLTDRANQVRMYLEYVPEDDIPWHVHYLALTGLSGLLLLTTYAGLYPFDIGWGMLTATLFLMFGLSAVVHTFQTRRSRLRDFDFAPLEG